ncbi:MAG TPA: TylF/MycF/NovP-related O-methyltransferase [Chryseolinea sp.]|nr:TylF/MycF/NovP-related O-methyltransferase [Chryseolinea sp.]
MGGELGDYLEFGVSLGTSMACMHRVLENRKSRSSIRLFGFDSFEGMPASAAFEDEGTWMPGEFASSIDQTRQYLDEAKIDWKRTHLIKGWFDETLTPETVKVYNIRKASIIMVDCDIYSASKTALNFALPMIVDFAVIFFDDWRDDITFGEYKAYSEFLNENKHLKSEMFGEYRPTGMIFLVTNTKEVH